jgi:ketosteroid isomerase-like protein
MSFSAGKISRRSWSVVALIALCVLGLSLVTGCGKGGGKTPEKTVQKFFKATKGKDLDGILACFAPDVREMFEEMIKLQGEDTIQKQLSRGDEKIGDLKILDTKIDGDWATVKTSVMVDGEKEESDIQVHKIDGVWYVDMPEEEKEGMKEALKMLKNMPKPPTN